MDRCAQISDHPAATDGSLHSIAVTGSFGPDGYSDVTRTIPIEVHRNSTKVERMMREKAILDIQVNQVNRSEIIFEQG